MKLKKLLKEIQLCNFPNKEELYNRCFVLAEKKKQLENAFWELYWEQREEEEARDRKRVIEFQQEEYGKRVNADLLLIPPPGDYEVEREGGYWSIKSGPFAGKRLPANFGKEEEK